jgi:GGDEF domain-containing protein
MAETQLQASTDTLTGLLNRRSFSQKVAAVPQHLHPVEVAMADLDHFKDLNDTYGHETGDRALRLFARVLRDALRGSDIVGRYGGEEFAIAFPGLLGYRCRPRVQHGAHPAGRRHHGGRPAQIHGELRHHRVRAGGRAHRGAPARR